MLLRYNKKYIYYKERWIHKGNKNQVLIKKPGKFKKKLKWTKLKTNIRPHAFDDQLYLFLSYLLYYYKINLINTDNSKIDHFHCSLYERATKGSGRENTVRQKQIKRYEKLKWKIEVVGSKLPEEQKMKFSCR